MRKIYSIAIAVLLLTATLSFGQSTNVIPTSFGPAPVLDVQSTGNGNPNSVFDVNSRGFIYLSTTTHQMAKQFMGNTTITNIGSPQTYGFPGAFARHTNGTIYVNDQLAPYGLYTLDTATGAKTLVVNITGITLTNLTGITWDGTQMWGVQSSITASQIGTISLTTGAFTPVGTSSTACAGAIMVNAAPNGTLFSVDIVADALFKWNKTTGVPTNVGPLGVNANYGQDGHFDWSDGKYYWASYTTAPQLRIIDTTNGSSVQVGANYTGQISCLAVKPYTAPVTSCSKIAGTWCPTNTYPSLPAASYFHTAAWIGDTMYVQQPSATGVGATTILKYTYGGAWTTGVPCLVGVTGASMSVSNGKLYLIGGGTTSVTTGGNTVQEYNPATGTWTSKSPLPAALSAHGSVTWGDSVIFVVGGPYTGAATNLNVHYYRPASDTWGTITSSLPSGSGRRTFALSISGNKIIMSCGFNTAYLKSTYVGTIGSNASLITWTPGADAPVALSRPAGTSYGNFAFVIGGDTNGTAVKNNKVFVYNVSGNAWITPILNCPNPSSNMMNAVTVKCINDTARIFQPGGYGTAAFTNFDVTGCGAILTGNSNITSEIPLAFTLSQNYPNPFNPTTKISYALPKSGLVTLKVYDILGKEVATLVNEVKNVGSYTVDFSGSNLSSGVYFYKLSVGDFSSIKKMTLIK